MISDVFRQQVSQDIRRRVTACFVALTSEARIAGFYTLASASLLLADLPPSREAYRARRPPVRNAPMPADPEKPVVFAGGASKIA